MSTMPRPFKVHGADGNLIEIPPGEFYINTKDRARRMMLNSLSSDARRVYACLELATIGFQRELAVKQNSEKKIVPLRPRDVVRATQLSDRAVRFAISELEREGLAKREGDEKKGLQNGHVRLYSWAVPRPTHHIKNPEARFRVPAWFPSADTTLLTLVKHLKFRLLPEMDEEARLRVVVRLDAVARTYEKALNAVVRELEQVSAPRKKRAYKKTTETTNTTGDPAAAASQSVPPEREPDRQTDSPASSPAERYAAIEAAIPPALCESLNETPTLTLLKRIDHNLAGAPLERFVAHVKKRYSAITGLGLLKDLADDVGKAWRKGAAARRDLSEAGEPGETMDSRIRRRYREHPEEREWLQEQNPEVNFEEKAEGAS